MSLLVSALFMLLNVAIILLIAYVILWVVRDWFGATIDPMVLKFAQVVVALLCLIVIVIWLTGIMGGTTYRLPFG
jgi:hypothetical protein